MIVPSGIEKLRNSTITLEENIYPSILIEVVPGIQSDKQLLKFDWSLVSFKPTEILIKLDFENKKYVSSHAQADHIRVSIYGLEFFVDMSGNFMKVPTILNLARLPSMAPESEISSAQSHADTSKSTMQVAFIANTVVTVIISGPL